MFHKFLFMAVSSAAMLALTGCSLFQSPYPERSPAAWEEKELLGESKRELAVGLTYYWLHFKDFKDGDPLSMHIVVADWKKLDPRVGVYVDSNGKAAPLQTASADAGIRILAAASGTETDRASGKPLTELKAGVPGGNSIRIAAADPGKAIPASAYALVSARQFLPMIIKSSPAVFQEKDFESVIQGMLLAKDGKSIFSHSIGGKGAYTVLGLNQKEKLMILLVVDGYHEKQSPGVAFSDLPEIMFGLGALDVLCINAGPCGALALPAEGSGKLEIVSYPADGGSFDHTNARPAQNRIVFGVLPVRAPVQKKSAPAAKPATGSAAK